MKSILIFCFFVNTLMISQADHDSRHARHSYVRDTNERRSRQNQWQPANYRNYESSYQHFYPRYDNAKRQEALTSEIIVLLRELKDNLSKQKQTQYYQPIYVPYPVQLSIAHNGPSSNNKPNIVPNKSVPSLPSRNNFAEDEKEYMRPIMLKPVTEAPSTTTTKVDDSESAIVFKAESQNEVKKPSRCQAAILVCCRFTQPDETKKCFGEHGCSKTYATRLACDKKAIQIVIQSFTDTFGPK